jgi:hypothetical protein
LTGFLEPADRLYDFPLACGARNFEGHLGKRHDFVSLTLIHRYCLIGMKAKESRKIAIFYITEKGCRPGKLK